VNWPLPYTVTIHVLLSRLFLLFIAFLSSLSHSSHVSFLSLPFQSYKRINERRIKNIALNSEHLLCLQLGPLPLKSYISTQKKKKIRRWFTILSLIRWQVGPIIPFPYLLGQSVRVVTLVLRIHSLLAFRRG
jgi:hypothetical protein